MHRPAEAGFADSFPACAPALPAGAENRASPRFTLLLRCARLVADGHEYICVLRDVSATGAKVRLFHPLPPAGHYELELPDGSRHAARPVWTGDSHAGFRFLQPIDVRRMLDERAADRPRRPLRIGVDDTAHLIAHGAGREVRLVNISQQGACIECDERLSMRQIVKIQTDLFPVVTARVCWRRQPRYGLVFETGFALEEFARALGTGVPTMAPGDAGTRSPDM